jgi:hypothetical protein
MRGLQAVALCLSLGACSPTEPELLWLSFGAYSSSPVVLLEFSVNEKLGMQGLELVTGSSEGQPRGSGGASLGYPPGEPPGSVAIAAQWVELFTGKAWRAEMTLAAKDLIWIETSGPTMLMTPVFGPNGLFRVTSETASSAGIVQKDVARLCGMRAPEADADFTQRADQVAQLTELLDFPYPPVIDPECPYPKD